MRCPYCHENIRVQGRFCPKCGEQIFGLPVRTPPQAPAAPATPQAAPLPPPVSAPAAPPPDLLDDTLDLDLEDVGSGSRSVPTPGPVHPPPTVPVSSPPGGTHPAAGEEVGKTCPYCRFPVKPGEEVYTCPACKVVHHQDCWRENQGCTTYGCRGAAAAAPTAAPPAYGPMVGTPRGPVGGVMPDFTTLAGRELEGRASNALWLALAGWFCCPPLTLVGLFMALSLLGEINRLPGAGRARSKTVGALVVGAIAVVFWIVMLVVQSQSSSGMN